MRRRDFIKAGTVGAAYFSVSGLTLLPQSANAAAISVNLVAETVQKTVATTATGASANVNVPAWQFRDTAVPGPGRIASGLQMRVGDTLNVTVSNTLDRPINFVVPGLLDSTPAVAPGASATYSVNPTVPGSYFYTDNINGKIGRAMGLAGPLVVLPTGATNAITASGTAFTKQYTLFLNELDSRLNTAVAAGGTFDMATYEPNYFFINGLNYPLTTADPSTAINLSLNESVAIRFINGGLIYYPMHFHGYHVDVTLRNRVSEKTVVSKDSVQVLVGECVDTLLLVNQLGDYPMHSHYLPSVTANGIYPYGNMLLMRAR